MWCLERFLEAMSERTKNLISAVFDEPNGRAPQDFRVVRLGKFGVCRSRRYLFMGSRKPWGHRRVPEVRSGENSLAGT